MAFQLSPGVNVTEIDLTTVVPAVSTSDGAIAGIFRWGPVGERILVDSENILAKRFGNPSNLNAETWFSAANFLGYGNRLNVVRAANTSGSTPYITFEAVEDSNTLVINTAASAIDNTSVLSEDMYIYQISNSSVYTTGLETSFTIVNSTAIQLSSNAMADDGAVNLYFARPQTAYSAVALADGGVVANLVNQTVKNQNDYISKDGDFDPDIYYIAKYPGAIGNSLRISVCDSSSAYTSIVNTGFDKLSFEIGNNVAVANGVASVSTFMDEFSVYDNILAGNSSIDFQYLKIIDINSPSANVVHFTFEDPYRLHTNFVTDSINRYWEFQNVVDSAPGQSDYVANHGNTSAMDEMHVVVVDDMGSFTGTPGTILEVYKGLSRATDAKNNDNTGNYYKDVINQGSSYIWWANDRGVAPSANAENVASSSDVSPYTVSFVYGADGYDEANTSAFSVIAAGYNIFASAEEVDISLVIQGKPLAGSTSVNGITVTSFQLANYIIDNICEIRKDCVAFVSPPRNLTYNVFGTEATNLVAFRGALRSSSYAVLDSGYKQMYDRYNDVYRWVPMNGDIAGLCARTDQTNDAWWSPAGYNRGQIKNIVKLAWNPRKSERDTLYSNGINPVVTFPGQGTVLYGDKTLLAKPSAFDRINVRRLFIVLEKAIATAAKYSLFEFNDTFTRSQFKNLINPYLRTVQGRRGITDFLVVCDETNNTPQIIDTNQFIGDIYIKPARSINFIQLNFVAVATGVQFSEVVGKF
jgi:phage tail sheath protein FI